MKSTELRIANYIYGVSDRIEQITELLSNGVETSFRGTLLNYSEYTDISPIELTHEWLTAFNFTLSSSKSELWSYGNTMLIWRTEYESDELDNYYEFRFGITSSYGAYRQVRLDYVHQLQNLTFVLTGEELKIVNP